MDCQTLFFCGDPKTLLKLFQMSKVHILKHPPCAMLDYVSVFLSPNLDLGPIDIGQDKKEPLHTQLDRDWETTSTGF